MDKKLSLFILVLLFTLTFSFASSYETHQTNTSLQYSFTSNNATSCNLTTANTPNGLIVLDQESTKNGQTFNNTISNSDLITLGDYCFNIVCTDGSTYATGSFCRTVTTNGREPADGIVVVVFVVIFIFIFGFGLVYFLKALAHVLDLNMDIIDSAVMLATYFSMWMFYLFSKEYLGNAFMNEILELAVMIGAFTHVLFPLIGFLVSFILTNLKFKQKARITY